MDLNENGEQRFLMKREAGISLVRRDGTQYSLDTDRVAADVEAWVSTQLNGIYDDTICTSGGDHGYDCVVLLGSIQVRVDAVHAGFKPDGTPRGSNCNLIVNCDSPKLYRSDLIVLVAGPPFIFLGGIPTARFLATAQLKNFGYGDKWAIPAQFLLPIASLFRRYESPGQE
jgi:hypothetical protein